MEILWASRRDVSLMRYCFNEVWAKFSDQWRQFSLIIANFQLVMIFLMIFLWPMLSLVVRDGSVIYWLDDNDIISLMAQDMDKIDHCDIFT